MIWEKLIGNVAFSGPCTFTGRTIGEVLALTSTLVVEIGSDWRAGAPPTRLA
jgi:hypothetical protein